MSDLNMGDVKYCPKCGNNSISMFGIDIDKNGISGCMSCESCGFKISNIIDLWNILSEFKERIDSLEKPSSTKETKLKDVDHNCLLKPVLFSEDEEDWDEFMLLSFNKNYRACYSAGVKIDKDDGFGIRVHMVFPFAKRHPDVIYGDEDE